MKCSLLIAFCLLLCAAPGLVWSQRSSYDPAAKQESKPGVGFVDFALKQINPKNTDYGCQLDEVRTLTVDQTIKNINSWAVLVALFFLVLSFVMLRHQHRERNRREAIAAEFLAQYHNAWVDARSQATEAIRRYNELVHTTNSRSEAVHRPSPPDIDGATARRVKADLSRDPKPQAAPIVTAKTPVKAGDNGSVRSDVARQVREPEVDLIAQISTLQQQLNASHEREKNLQKELSRAQRRAPAEQPRDVNLPG